MTGYKGMNAAPSIRGKCAICKQLNITNEHYRKAHGLVPKDIFSYDDKMWRCRKHLLKSPDPHIMMGHYWRAHMYSHSSKLPYKTREPLNGRGRYYGYEEMNKLDVNTSGVVANTSDYPPITAEAIVKAFEDRVKTIDKALEAKESTIIAISNALGKKRAELDEQQIYIEAAHKEIDKLRDELSRANEQFGVVEDKTNSLIARLFKR